MDRKTLWFSCVSFPNLLDFRVAQVTKGYTNSVYARPQCCPYVDKGQLHRGRTSYLQLEMAHDGPTKLPVTPLAHDMS